MKRTKKIWLNERIKFDNDGNYIKEDLEKILNTLNGLGATYAEIIDDEVDFYIEREETDEEYKARLKSEADANRLLNKFKFNEAKQFYLKHKDEFES